MIYEVRTYNAKPGKLPELIERIGDLYEHRAKYSKAAGFWYTDIGPLNQLVHIWPYESVAERQAITARLFDNYVRRVEANPEGHGMGYVHAYLVLTKV